MFKTQLFPSLTVPVSVCMYDCPVFKARTRKLHHDRHSSTILDGLKPCEIWGVGVGGGGVGLGLNFPSVLFKIVVRHIPYCFD